ncbi:hypothetical protein A1O3_05883 [Capronia epimyces CBS 606.96]|uniref:Uncharacterized protein n=1 Tax=Capronia epimyces CBS 606.96 TaxID=1182542 RepID=W9XY75_9EURO|nr:uncharacterized protein A1O3_05883 [Capronia epimyces CBS 606.96]EXJ85208.1 hypothetical protein A1O3_05883 [Capronia epimyces CBS 606.96]
MGNGAKAAQKRERNAKDGKKEPNSQLKSNAKAQSIKCKICFATFQSTTARKGLDEHASNKHSKSYEDCFA